MRTNATLMEEISHVFLGHQPSRLKVVAENESGRTISRDYRKADEEAAYATGAAALVPFSTLRRLVLEGQTSVQIARHFQVSRELVEYRLKVTRLWKTYREGHLESAKL
jgi:Zn-dependent peptidase ImmA (M78 family)